MALHVIRAIFVMAVLAIAASYALSPEVQGSPVLDPDTGKETGFSIVAKVTLVMVVPVVLAVGLVLVDMAFKNKSLLNISGLFFGVVAGVFLAYIIGMVVELGASVFVPDASPAPAPKSYKAPSPIARRPTMGSAESPTTGPAESGQNEKLKEEIRTLREQLEYAKRETATERTSATGQPALVKMIKLLVGACAIYLCVSFVMQTKDDFRFVIPYVEFSRQSKGSHPLILDTSAIIDGRIADIAETRILEGVLVVPRFVVEETQNIADSSDKLRRSRGRRGLDMLNRLRGNDKIEVKLHDAHIPVVEDATEVDHKLVALAEHMDGKIVTNDYNLNKVAQLRGVDVININDLANALKPVVLPGEAVTVKIIKPGEESGQGIGYLDDGTMVVVEQGRNHIGEDLEVTVTSTLQTSAGRMIFGKAGNNT